MIIEDTPVSSELMMESVMIVEDTPVSGDMESVMIVEVSQPSLIKYEESKSENASDDDDELFLSCDPVKP